MGANHSIDTLELQGVRVTAVELILMPGPHGKPCQACCTLKDYALSSTSAAAMSSVCVHVCRKRWRVC